MKQMITARIRCKNSILPLAILINCVYFLSACVGSSGPSSEELIKTRTPTFLGSTSASFTTGTPAYNLVGECDPISYGIEYSYNNTTWTTHAPGCVLGGFNIPVITNGIRKIYVRSLTKKGYTDPAIATLRLILPPTSPAFQVVSAGHGANEGDRNTTFTIGVVDGVPTSSVANGIDSNITGIVYAP